MNIALMVALLSSAAAPLAPGDATRTLDVAGRCRSYHVHVPPKFDPVRPTPVVLIFHGAGINGSIMARVCGMDRKAGEAGFVAVYPDGTGWGPFLTFNAGGVGGRRASAPDDVRFVSQLLDDLATVMTVDSRRVYATGLSNGGMLCYRLAAELSDRIAAIAPVAGTMAIKEAKPTRPVPVLHFHGTEDRIVPWKGPGFGTPRFLYFQSVEETIATWAKLNGCPETPRVEALPDKADDGTCVERRSYGPGREGSEVMLIVIRGGGHTWPGRPPVLGVGGKSTEDISANDLIWDFFQRHPRP